jgi:hypothetical protein
MNIAQPSLGDVKMAAAKEAEKRAGGVQEWIDNSWAAGAVVDKARASAASSSAAAAPREKSQQEIEAQAAKKARVREAKDTTRVETEGMVRQRQREIAATEKAAKAREEEAKLVTYTGVPDPKAVMRDDTNPGLSQVVGVIVGGGHPAMIVPTADIEVLVLPKKKKYVLSCDNAGVCGAADLMWTEFLLVDPDGSWQGRIWGQCQPCSGLDAASFKKEAAKRQRQRAELMKGRVQRAHSITFDNAERVIGAMFEGTGLANHRIRTLAVMRVKSIATHFVQCFGEMNEHAKKVAGEITANYMKELMKSAEDISYAAPVDAQTLTAEECSYLCVVGEGVTFSFVCRYPDCLFFGRNDKGTWPQEFGHYHFRCPRCGRDAAPCSTKKKQIDNLAFVLMLVDPVTQAPTHIPTVWPPSEEMGWLNNMIELEARQIETPQDVQDWFSKSKLNLHELIMQEQVPQSFERFAWGSGPWGNIEHMLTKYEYEEIKERGYYYGAILDRSTAEGPLFSNWTEIIGLCANVVASTKAMLQASKL